MIARSRRQQNPPRRGRGEQAAVLDTQIHNPRSSEKLKRESETTTEVAAQKTIESHNEVQKVVKGERVSRSASSKAMLLTM